MVRTGRWLIALGFWAVGSGTWAHAAGSREAWGEAAGLRCILSDEVDPGARIFDAPDFRETLVVPERGDEAWVLSLKAQTVRSIPKGTITWDDHQLPIPDEAAGTDIGGFLKQEGSMVFVAGDWTVEVQPEPPLVGELTREALEAAKVDYVHAARAFDPDSAAIAFLKTVRTDTRIVVFFGSWCSHCKHWVPGFLKSLDVAANVHLSPEFHAVSEDMLEPAAALKRYGVGKTPTFIVIQGGKELGRIEEEPEVSIEADLTRILGGR